MGAELETRWAPRSAQAATAFHVRMKTNLSPTSSLTTIAVTKKTASANPFRESCGVSVYRGGRKKKPLPAGEEDGPRPLPGVGRDAKTPVGHSVARRRMIATGRRASGSRPIVGGRSTPRFDGRGAAASDSPTA